MFTHNSLSKMVLGGVCMLVSSGCGHRQGGVVSATAPRMVPVAPPLMMVMSTTAPVARLTFKSNPPAIQFDYPGDWVSDKAQTAVFAIKSPQSSCYASLSLDIPKLPWHLPGMITLNMVADGYVDDLRKNQIHDAVVKERCSLTLCGTKACRITSVGTEKGSPSIDVAVITIHDDHVYILSADSDEKGYETAKRTLDAAAASLKWVK